MTLEGGAFILMLAGAAASVTGWWAWFNGEKKPRDVPEGSYMYYFPTTGEA